MELLSCGNALEQMWTDRQAKTVGLSCFFVLLCHFSHIELEIVVQAPNLASCQTPKPLATNVLLHAKLTQHGSGHLKMSLTSLSSEDCQLNGLLVV